MAIELRSGGGALALRCRMAKTAPYRHLGERIDVKAEPRRLMKAQRRLRDDEMESGAGRNPFEDAIDLEDQLGGTAMRITRPDAESMDMNVVP